MTPDSKVSDVERAAFETWFGSLHLSPEWSLERLAHDFGTLRKGDYISAEGRYAFKAWLARANQQPSAQWIAVSERVPELGVSVLTAVHEYQDVRKPYAFTVLKRTDTHIWHTGEEEDEGEYYTPEYWMPLDSLRALLPQSPDTMRKG